MDTNEKRLIDGLAFLDKVLLHYTECERNGKLMHASCEIKQNIADMVVEAPTVDTVEAVHAKWEEVGVADYKCSRCGFRFTSADPMK